MDAYTKGFLSRCKEHDLNPMSVAVLIKNSAVLEDIKEELGSGKPKRPVQVVLGLLSKKLKEKKVLLKTINEQEMKTTTPETPVSVKADVPEPAPYRGNDFQVNF